VVRGDLLGGEAGLRAGEVRALRWGDDVDMTARTLTVNQQLRHLRWMGHKRNDETMLYVHLADIAVQN
jgi:hypothetical protein